MNLIILYNHVIISYHFYFCFTHTGPSGNSGLAICVTRRTKNGVYRGQLTKNNALVNGGEYKYICTTEQKLIFNTHLIFGLPCVMG